MDEEELGCFDSNLVTASVALVLLWLFLSFGAWMFTLNEDWTFLDSFYFCFITMTTIGPAISHTNESIFLSQPTHQVSGTWCPGWVGTRRPTC